MKSVTIILLIVAICIYGKTQDIAPVDTIAKEPTNDLTSRKIGKDYDGGKVYLLSSYENKGEKLRKTFTISVNEDGYYFLAAHVLAVNEIPFTTSEVITDNEEKTYPLHKISVYLDEKNLGELDLKYNGWQPATLKENKQVYFDQGEHEVSFECSTPYYPEIDVIKLTTVKDKATFDMSKYDEYISILKMNMKKNKGIKEKMEMVESSLDPQLKSASDPSSDWEVTPYTLNNSFYENNDFFFNTLFLPGVQ